MNFRRHIAALVVGLAWAMWVAHTVGLGAIGSTVLGLLTGRGARRFTNWSLDE